MIEENASEDRPKRKRRTKPLSLTEKKAILLALKKHSDGKADGNGMTEREFLELLLGPRFDKRMKKGEKRVRGTLKRAFPVDKLWAECKFIRDTAAKANMKLIIPKETAAEKRERDCLLYTSPSPRD